MAGFLLCFVSPCGFWTFGWRYVCAFGFCKGGYEFFYGVVAVACREGFEFPVEVDVQLCFCFCFVDWFFGGVHDDVSCG